MRIKPQFGNKTGVKTRLQLHQKNGARAAFGEAKNLGKHLHQRRSRSLGKHGLHGHWFALSLCMINILFNSSKLRTRWVKQSSMFCHRHLIVVCLGADMVQTSSLITAMALMTTTSMPLSSSGWLALGLGLRE